MLLKGVRLFSGGKLLRRDILIEGEAIKGIGKFSGKGLDCSKYIALPGLIDCHVHMRDPGPTQKEDFHTGTRAAIAGGVTTIMDMPNNPGRPTVTVKALKEKKKIAAKKAVCDWGLHFGATERNFAEIRKARPRSLKLYTGQSTGELLVPDVRSIWMHMGNFPRERPLMVHAEDQETIEAMQGLGEGRAALSAKIAVSKCRLMAEGHKRLVYFCHLSTPEEVDIAKGYGKAVVEVTPHHLFLSSKDANRMEKDFGKVYPPLRSPADVAGMWKRLEKIDVYATDHAPHLPEEKMKGAAGFPGLETSLALMLDAYNKKRVTLEWIVQRCCENPARIFGLRRKGKIAKGHQADITLIDLKRKWKVRAEDMESKCGWTPYEGKTLQGKAEKVIFRGELVYDGGIVKEKKGKDIMP